MKAPGFETNRKAGARPFFSICIPQYNRTDFLIKACETFVSQRFRDFEVCISDDCSNDGKQSDLIGYLRNTSLVFTYSRTKSNLRYDGNLRSAISLSSGHYLILMGNDDGFSDSEVLQYIHAELVRLQPIAVAISNYQEAHANQVFHRMIRSGVVGEGSAVAAAMFRRFSFVSGVVLEGNAARNAATDVLDGTEMYQMYLGTRLVANGGRFLAIDRVCIDKDLQIPGQVVDSYRLKPRVSPCRIIERPLPMGRLLEVVAVGLEPCADGENRERNLIHVGAQLYRFTYPFWILEYRRVQSWRYAFGVFLALRPNRVARGLGFSRFGVFRLWLMYLSVGAIALSIPIALFDALRPRLYAIGKMYRAS